LARPVLLLPFLALAAPASALAYASSDHDLLAR
jgi:hypothetical protein